MTATVDPASGPAITAFPRVGAHRPNTSGADRVLRTVLCHITPLITGSHDQSFLQELMPALCELFGASRCSVLLLDRPGDVTSMLRLEAHAGLPKMASTKRDHNGGVAAVVLKHGQPTLIVAGDGSFDTRFAGVAPRFEAGSSLCAPIATPTGCVFGTLNVSRGGPADPVEPLTSRDLEVCDAIAMLIGDTLERLQSRDAERELRERLRAVEHLSMLGEVAAGIAHEIANPLASVHANVIALAEYLTELAPLFESAQDDLAAVAADLPVLLGDVQEGITRVEDIITNMKAMVRINREVQQADVVCLADVVHSVARLVRPRMRAKLIVDVAPSVLVLGRTIDLTQVLLNLIINADDACHERAQVDAERRDVPTEVRIEAGVIDEDAFIDVADNGTGISEANLIKVFQPLFSTKGGKGTGLGLSICQRLTEALGGRLDVTSTVGAGTTFRLWLHRGASPT